VVAYNMSEWRSFAAVCKGARNDVAVLLTTFLLTVLVDLTVAIEIGMVLAVFLFMRKMIHFSNVRMVTNDTGQPVSENGKEEEVIGNFFIPDKVEVFEITGPLFFGAAYKFKDAMRLIESPPKILILRMRQVPIIDATGIITLQDVFKESTQRGTKLILSEVHSVQVMEALKKSRLLFAIGKGNVTTSLEKALSRSSLLLKEVHPRDSKD